MESCHFSDHIRDFKVTLYPYPTHTKDEKLPFSSWTSDFQTDALPPPPKNEKMTLDF